MFYNSSEVIKYRLYTIFIDRTMKIGPIHSILFLWIFWPQLSNFVHLQPYFNNKHILIKNRKFGNNVLSKILLLFKWKIWKNLTRLHLLNKQLNWSRLIVLDKSSIRSPTVSSLQSWLSFLWYCLLSNLLLVLTC